MPAAVTIRIGNDTRIRLFEDDGTVIRTFAVPANHRLITYRQSPPAFLITDPGRASVQIYDADGTFDSTLHLSDGGTVYGIDVQGATLWMKYHGSQPHLKAYNAVSGVLQAVPGLPVPLNTADLQAGTVFSGLHVSSTHIYMVDQTADAVRSWHAQGDDIWSRDPSKDIILDPTHDTPYDVSADSNVALVTNQVTAVPNVFAYDLA